MSQQDLFGVAEAAGPPPYQPDPIKVRARLERIVGEARAADTIPWGPSQVNLYRTIVPDMTKWLPDDEGERWRSEFERELARLAPEA